MEPHTNNTNSNNSDANKALDDDVELSAVNTIARAPADATDGYSKSYTEPFAENTKTTGNTSAPDDKTVNVDNERRFSAKVPMNTSPLALVWENLSITAPDSKGQPTLLHPTSGVLRPGLHALIGPTGAGKSVFLNALAGQSATNLKVDGRVVVNGKQIHGESAKTILSLVTQDDTLDGNLTVGECLDFAAQMQLGHMSSQERHDLVDDLLVEVGIDHVKDTIIGTALRRGISGGQRRRTAVSVGLLRQPRVLILDEPTCGLDSTCALNLLRTLRALADKGAVVIFAIHQPQQAIFDLFDTLLCIRGGLILYNDDAVKCIPFLENLGLPYDGVTASADHIIEIISPSTGQSVEAKEAECPLMRTLPKSTVDATENSDVPVDTNVTKQSWGMQCLFLIQRFLRAESRKYGTHAFNLVCTLGCALLVSAAYYNIPYTQKGQKLRLSVVFFCCINQSLFGAMKVILAFPEQRILMLAERRAGFYSASPFIVAVSVVDFVYTLIWPFLFALPVVFLTNLGQSAEKYFGFAFMLLLDKMCATGLALMVVSLARTASASLVILPMAIEASRLFSGYYLTPNAVPDYFVWLDPLSYVKYAFVGAALNELKDTTFACATTTNVTTGVESLACNPAIPTTGAGVASMNGYDYISYGGCVGALLAYLLLTRVITYVALRFLKSVS